MNNCNMPLVDPRVAATVGCGCFVLAGILLSIVPLAIYGIYRLVTG